MRIMSFFGTWFLGAVAVVMIVVGIVLVVKNN